MSEVAIKGAAIKGLVADVQRLVDEGRISQVKLQARLRREELELLEDGVLDSIWYPIDGYERMTELLREVDGGGAVDYVRKRGAALADRLVKAGLYQQVKFVQRMGQAESLEQAVSNLRLTGSLWNGFFNVGQWDVFYDGHHREYGMVVREAAGLPPVALEAICGFMERLALETGRRDSRVDMERPSGDVVRFIFRFEGDGQ